MKKLIKIIAKIFAFLLLGTLLFIGYGLVHRAYITRGAISSDEIQKFTMEEMPIDQKDFKDNFEQIFERVNDRYSYIQSKHLNMDSLHAVFLSRIDTAKTKIAYGLILKEFFAELKAGHADDRSFFFSYHLGENISLIENRVFINKPSELIKHAGFLDKDEIITVDGQPVNSWIRSQEKYVSASTEAYRHLLTAHQLLASNTDSLRTFDIIRSGKPMTITANLKYIKELYGDWTTVTSEQLSPELGIIRINSMTGDAVHAFCKALNKLRHLPNLIIDVRANGGGSSEIGDKIAEYLIKGTRKAWNDWDLEPAVDSYKGKVFILQDTYSFSSTESFLITMKESGDAVLVGLPSAGDTGGLPLTFKTSYDFCFRIPTRKPQFSPKGFPLEGKAIRPHYIVAPRVADFLAGKDTQVEYVKKLMRETLSINHH